MGFEPTTLRVLTIEYWGLVGEQGSLFWGGLTNRIGAWFRIPSVAQFFFCVLLSLILYISHF